MGHGNFNLKSVKLKTSVDKRLNAYRGVLCYAICITLRLCDHFLLSWVPSSFDLMGNGLRLHVVLSKCVVCQFLYDIQLLVEAMK